MSAIRDTLRALRTPPGIALLVGCALLVCSQIVEVAHSDFDCEHDSCSVCTASAGENGFIGEAALTAPARRQHEVDSPASTSILQACPAQARLIRGPPKT